MSEKDQNSVVYAPQVIEFVTVGVEFCSFLEKEGQPPRQEWVETVTRILPLLYIKASLLPETIVMDDESTETFVKEEDYARVTATVASIMGEEDIYLDVFVEDMKYSDRPVSSFVSEDIADIYQDVRNFISVYQYGLSEQMNDALFVCRENFRTYWGQKLVNVLRPLHALLYKEPDFLDADEDINTESLWD